MKKQIPNMITVFRMIGTIILIIYIYRYGLVNRYQIALIVVFLAFTDLLDGFLARHFHLESKLGMILDPVADKIFNWGLAITLMFKGLMPLWVLIIGVRDVIAFILAKLLHDADFDISPTIPAKLKMAFQSIGLISAIAFGFGTKALTLIAPIMIIMAIIMTFIEFFVVKEKYSKYKKALT